MTGAAAAFSVPHERGPPQASSFGKQTNPLAYSSQRAFFEKALTDASRTMSRYEMRQEPTVLPNSWAIVATDENGAERFIMRYLTEEQAANVLERFRAMGAVIQRPAGKITDV